MVIRVCRRGSSSSYMLQWSCSKRPGNDLGPREGGVGLGIVGKATGSPRKVEFGRVVAQAAWLGDIGGQEKGGGPRIVRLVPAALGFFAWDWGRRVLTVGSGSLSARLRGYVGRRWWR